MIAKMAQARGWRPKAALAPAAPAPTPPAVKEAEAQIDRWRRDYGGFAKGVAAMPRSYLRLSDEDVIQIDGDQIT